MSSAAANADLPPLLPRPSLFISYASENRAAARLLRDTLEAAGLDVWYDENELGGGDAWDQKIRRQIRECTYFMPVISAQTEARREGYFRREWRLAVDRSHDMADDVMFLIPVVIDGTPEGGARVPEKFLTVQWLKLPGGVATPALTALAQKLAHGDHVAPATAVPPRVTATPARASRPPQVESKPAEGPPPIPPFPDSPRHNIKYFADIIAWAFVVMRLVFKRLPKWVRVLLIIWLCVSFISRCSHDSNETTSTRRKTKPVAAKTTEGAEQKDAESLREAANELEKVAGDPATGNLGAGFARAGAEIARAVSKEIGATIPGNSEIGVVPFAGGVKEPAARKFADQVFGRVFGQLTLARPGRIKVQTTADPTADDATLVALAAEAGHDRLLAARVETKDGETELVVRLLTVKPLAVVWRRSFMVKEDEVATVAGQITQEVLAEKPTTPPSPPPIKS